MLEKEVQSLQQQLLDHPLYSELNTLSKLQVFMQFHCFAVWDFMTLLKALQQRISCIYLPWYPSPYPTEAVRFINEIVLIEESDLDANGHAKSHFETYLEAMKEVEADTSAISSFINNGDLNALPIGVKEFVKFDIELAFNGSDEELAAAFLLGREKVLPRIYGKIKNTLLQNKIKSPILDNYLQRHIDVGGQSHAPFSNVCFDLICGNNRAKRMQALHTAKVSLQMRDLLWNAALEEMTCRTKDSRHLKLA